MVKLKEGFTGERIIVMPQIIINTLENDPFTSLLHITDIGYYPNAKHHFRERKEAINQYIFIFCINGKGWYKINNVTYKVEENQYFIIPPGCNHSYGSDKDDSWSIYWIHFKGTVAHLYTKETYSPVDLKTELNSNISEILNLFEEMYNILKKGYNNNSLKYLTSLFQFFLGSLTYNKPHTVENNNEINLDDVVEASIHYMNENIEKQITLKDISDYIGYSQSHISMIFKQKTGHSPITYINLLKIRKACDLLDNTDMKINQINFKIGIKDYYYFSRLFHKIMGISPNDYRGLKKG